MRDKIQTFNLPANTGGSQKGFTLIEIVVSVAIASVLLASTSALIKSMVHYYQTMQTVQIIKKIENALEITYMEAIRYVEANCTLGWQTPGVCSQMSPIPQKDPSITVSHLYVTNPTEKAIQAWEDAGCSTVGSAWPRVYIYCYDAFKKGSPSTGSTFNYTISNSHIPGTLYVNGYSSTPATITITSTGNPDISETWSAGYLDNEYLNYSKRKIITVTNTLKQYHLNRLLHESIVNTCDNINGGLESYDDVIIPWYFQVTGSYPQQECTGIESLICGCSNYSASVWPTSSGWRDVTGSEWTAVLNNLNLSGIYASDGFGNALTLWLTVDSTDAIQNVPPRPRPNYNGVWSIKPPYAGLIGVYNASTNSWIYKDKIVYPQ